MKNTYQKLISTILLLSFLIPFTIPKKSYAIFGVGDTADVILGAILGTDVAKKIMDGVYQVEDTVSRAYNLYQNTLAAKQLVQNIKNFDASTFAQNASSDALFEVGEAVVENLGITKDESTNVYTKGQQVVTNFGNYLDKISVNEIKKGLSNLQITINTTPYNADISKSVTDFVRETSDTALGKVVNFSLPYIAKDEICNSPQLKDIIKNGEPETFVRAKKAVGNIDIDKLCNTSLQKPQKEASEAQASFIGLAKAGYGGPKTSAALSDSTNTPSGVVSMAVSNILSQKDKVVKEVSKQTEATGMFLGDQKCIDKDGKEVKFDPTDPTQYCDQQFSTAQGSGSVLGEKVAAAAAAPYQSILARTEAIHDKLKNGDFSAAADAMKLVSSILQMGQKDVYSVMNDPYDNPYKGLADSLSSLQSTQDTRNLLTKNTEQESREFHYGSDKYTTDDLQNALEVYAKIRTFNTQKLNTYTYSYLLLKTSVDKAKAAVDEAKKEAKEKANKWGGWYSVFHPVKTNTAAKASKNKAEAAKKLNLALISMTTETRNLIKEMAKNNYREQQIRKLLLELRETKDIDTENNQEALAQALDGTYTEKDYAFFVSDWNYIPEYSEIHSDPYTATTKDASYYIPTREEIEGPYTENLLRYLRVRAYLMLKDSLEAGVNPTIPTKDKATFDAYDVKNFDYLTPNLPRPSKTTTALIDTDDSISYSELSYCNQVKIGICNKAELQTLADSINSFDYSYNDPGLDLLKEKCPQDLETNLRNLCSNAVNSQDLELKEICKDETSIEEALQIAREECAKY